MVFFFPGQGSQFVGMGKDLVTQYPLAKVIYQQANEILGYDIQKLSFEGPEAGLTDTKNAQPAILIYQYILLSLLKEKNIVPTAVAGHSLGEFSALLASGMLDFEDTLRIVQKRGELIAGADPEQKGSMAAVLGLDDEVVIAICREVSQEFYVTPVNFNTPGQVVISGFKEGIALAGERLKDVGAKRVIPLSVSGAFHSKFMEKASQEFGVFIENYNFQKPQCPIISNVTAKPYDETTVKELLSRQMRSPVQWVRSVQYLVEKDYTKGVEVSSGSVIQGMVKKIYKDFVFKNITDLI